jgi:hypothetical protein
MDAFFQKAAAFPVDNAHLKNLLFAAGLEIIGKQLLQVPGIEGVQIESSVDGDINGPVSCGILILIFLNRVLSPAFPTN